MFHWFNLNEFTTHLALMTPPEHLKSITNLCTKSWSLLNVLVFNTIQP
jgi:hypothetical protein